MQTQLASLASIVVESSPAPTRTARLPASSPTARANAFTNASGSFTRSRRPTEMTVNPPPFGAARRVAIARSTRSRSAPFGTTRDRPRTSRSRGRGRLSYADRLQNTIRRKAAREMIIISWFRTL